MCIIKKIALYNYHLYSAHSMDADVIIYYHLLRQLRHSSSLDKVGSFLHKPWNQG